MIKRVVCLAGTWYSLGRAGHLMCQVKNPVTKYLSELQCMAMQCNGFVGSTFNFPSEVSSFIPPPLRSVRFRSFVLLFSSRVAIRPSRFPSSSHSKDGCEPRTNPLSVSPPSPRSTRRVIVARVQLCSFLVPLHRSSSSSQVICQTVGVLSFLLLAQSSDEWSNLSCCPIPLPLSFSSVGRVQYPK